MLSFLSHLNPFCGKLTYKIEYFNECSILLGNYLNLLLVMNFNNFNENLKLKWVIGWIIIINISINICVNLIASLSELVYISFKIL